MSDWGTMVQLIKEETHRVTSVSSDHIKRAIVEAIDFHREQPFWFNRAEDDTAGVADTYTYTLPADFLGLREDPQVQIGDNWVEVPPSSRSEDLGYHLETDLSPMKITFSERWDIPTTGFKIIYTKDLGGLSYSHDGTTWTFTDEDTGTDVLDTYTNAWFDSSGREVTKNFAIWKLFSGVHKQPEAANMYLGRYNQALKNARTRSSRRRFTGRATGYL